MNQWGVVQSKPQKEDVARDHLTDQGFEIFLPMLKEHKGKEVRLIPLFPRYMFITVGQTERVWSRINNTKGVQRLIMGGGGKPALLPKGWVEARIAEGEIVDKFVPSNMLKKDDIVHFMEGPFAGRSGILQTSGQDRVEVLLYMLGRETTVTSHHSILKKV